MIDKLCLNKVLKQYKKDFVSKQWENENYKWEAVKCFQDNWDIRAEDFANMLSVSLSKTYNLLASMNRFPAQMIIGFAKIVPEEIRAMFIMLFDESKDITERIESFKLQSSIMLERYGNGAKQHFQDENSISTYLWLRYPNKYYIYKYSEIKKVSDELKSDYKFKKGAYKENFINFNMLYDEICEELKKDKSLIDLIQSQLTDSLYSDPELHTLTIDVGFYISRYYSQNGSVSDSAEWFPMDYDPGFSENDWITLLNDKTIFTTNSLEIMKRMKDYGGEATCKQLAVKYGESFNFYNSGSTSLARRIVEKTGCPVMPKEIGHSKWWPVLYLGRDANKDEDGIYVWKLREELSKALDKTDLSEINLFAHGDTEKDGCGYWWLNANPKMWSFSNLSVGESEAYTLYNDAGNKRHIFQNFLDAKVGDMVIGYESNPVKQIVAIGRISSEQDGKQIYFEKLEGLPSPIDYQVIKNIPELAKMEFLMNPNGSLFKLTKGEYDYIIDIIRDSNPIHKERKANSYSSKDFLNDVFISEPKYNALVGVLKNKKNIILQGAPGVGKTYAAKRLAYSLMGECDDDRIEFVQFHQNYSYEDFVMGYKPVEDRFDLKYGVFYRFCQKAANEPDKDYFFIIDEINRGNLSKIFGELLMLIEKDYRGERISLAYNELPFSVPKNVYIIGMMNTADRSLAMIDYALRRRFSFFDMEPGFDSDGFIRYQKSLNSDTLDELIQRVKDLNNEIRKDKSLGSGFCIGHSYFCGRTECTDDWLREVVNYDILPMLREYWFDEPDKVTHWSNVLQGVFQ